MLAISAIHAATPKTSPHLAKQWSWATEEWTGDNAPYHRIRLYIDKCIAHRQDPIRLAQQYRLLALKNPADPQAQFRWAYAARQAALAVQPFDESKLLGVHEAMDRARHPHAYDYTRLRFLVGTEMVQPYDWANLKPAGERLLRRDAYDTTVKYQLLRILIGPRSSVNGQQALSYAQELVQQEPKKPRLPCDFS